MAKLPHPPAALAIPPAISRLSAGTLLWRIYFAGGAYPGVWNGLRSFGPTAARFDHHPEPPTTTTTHGILYAATGSKAGPTCVAEVFQSARLVDRVRDAPWLVAFETTRDLDLLDLTGTWPTRAGASMAIASGPRPIARRWSRAIYAAYPKVEGLLYGSSMYANHPALALYERAATALPALPVFHRALADRAMTPFVANAALEVGYRVV